MKPYFIILFLFSFVGSMAFCQAEPLDESGLYQVLKQGKEITSRDGKGLYYYMLTDEEVEQSIPKLLSSEDLEEMRGKGKIRCYKINVGKLQPGQAYELYNYNLKGLLLFCGSWVVNKKGELIGEESGGHIKNCFFPSNYVKGETIEVYLVAKDRKTWMHMTTSPNPIVTTGKNGRALSAELVAIDPDYFHIKGTGFEANEVIAFESRSSGEVINDTLKADKHGNFTLLYYTPDVLFLIGGVSTCTFVTKKDMLTLDFYWGNKLYGSSKL